MKKDTKAHVTTAAISGESLPDAHRESMSHNSQKCQNKIDIQAAETTNMQSELKRAQNENERCRQAFDSSCIAHITSKAVNNLQTKPDRSSSGVAKSPSYAAKPYNGKPRPSWLSPGVMVLWIQNQLAITARLQATGRTTASSWIVSWPLSCRWLRVLLLS